MRLRALLILAAATLGHAAVVAEAQPPPVAIRLALLSQWVVGQHRTTTFLTRGEIRPEFASALERGVVDRVVVWRQRGLIQRESLVRKPVRVLAAAEAAPLGGRGEFELRAAAPPRGAAAWTEVTIAPRGARPDDVLVVEIGGELSTVTQVLETLFIGAPNGELVELDLARSALFRSEGVQIVTAPFGRPFARRDAPALFHGLGGVELLVVRSLVEAMVDAGTTPRGRADVSPSWASEWREGDRVFVRVPLAVLRERTPVLVLGWKDRTLLSPLGAGRD